MSQYIPLIDYGKHMKIEKGDAILVSSDAKKNDLGCNKQP